MNTSDTGWFKKFLGENPNAKALRERLEEATALLASKDEALLEQDRRLTDATALAQRGADSVRELETRLRELTETVTETDLSRSVTGELLEQTEAQVNQLNDALAVEHTKLIAANQAFVKADANVKALGTQVQTLEKQVAELVAQVASLEQERATAQKAKSMLESALTRSERRRESTLAELSESRATGERLSIACENSEARVRALASQLETSSDVRKQAETEASRCRAASAELTSLAASALYAAVGHSVPVALRVGDSNTAAALNLGGAANDDSVDGVATALERWFSDVGVSVAIQATSPLELVIELKGNNLATGKSNLALGYWVGGLTMRRFSLSTHQHYKLRSVEASAGGATIVLRLPATVRAAE